MAGSLVFIWVISFIFYYFSSQGSGRESLMHDFLSEGHAVFFNLILSGIVIASGTLLSNKIMALKESEAELKKKSEDYRIIAENSNDVIWKMNSKGQMLYVSPSVKKLRGYTTEEVLNQTLEEILTPSSLMNMQELMKQLDVLTQNNPKRMPSVVTQMEQPCKDGRTVWTEASVSTIMNENNEPGFFIGVSRDITDRKRREEEIRQSEKYYRLLAETSLDFILVHDMAGKILYVNPSGLKASGYSEEGLAGKSLKELIPEDYHAELEFHWNKRQAGIFDTLRYELEFVNREGKRIPIEVSSAPILLNKKPISIIVSARDISDRKQAEKKSLEIREKIQKLNQELEIKVKERTLMLQQAYKELETFSYSVSHDLRAPLRHIELFSDLLMKNLAEGANEKNIRFLNSIYDSSRKMRELIDSLLQLSRMSRHKMKKENFSMKLLVEQVLNEIKQGNHPQYLNLEVEELGEAYADLRLIRQVWFNLISNAIKFTSKNENPEIRIGQLSKEGKTVWFIKDNGVGFNPQYKEKLFGFFQRLHSESEFEGNGIGLASVKKIIDKHEGDIWADSKPGEGASFYFRLN